MRLLDATHPEGVRTARVWLYRGEGETPYNVFDFHENRSRDGPQEFLSTFQGWVGVDVYGVDGGVYLESARRIRASCCLAHARPMFDEAMSSHPTLAAHALGLFRQLYDLEDQAREFSSEARRAPRWREAVPLLAKLRARADEQAGSALPKLKLGVALGYLRNQWDALSNYVEDGRLPIENYATERDFGADHWTEEFSIHWQPPRGAASGVLYTVLASAARHGLDLWDYLAGHLGKTGRRR